MSVKILAVGRIAVGGETKASYHESLPLLGEGFELSEATAKAAGKALAAYIKESWPKLHPSLATVTESWLVVIGIPGICVMFTITANGGGPEDTPLAYRKAFAKAALSAI